MPAMAEANDSTADHEKFPSRNSWWKCPDEIFRSLSCRWRQMRHESPLLATPVFSPEGWRQAVQSVRAHGGAPGRSLP